MGLELNQDEYKVLKKLWNALGIWRYTFLNKVFWTPRRITLTQMSSDLGISVEKIKETLEKLEKMGIIKVMRTRINPKRNKIYTFSFTAKLKNKCLIALILAEPTVKLVKSNE